MDEEELEEYENEDGEDYDEPLLYVEIATDFIYECKLFPGFVLVRPATPLFYTALRRLNHLDFAKEFKEFFGDIDTVREYLRGLPGDIEIQTLG